MPLIAQYEPIPGTNDYLHVSDYDGERFIHHANPQRYTRKLVNGQHTMVPRSRYWLIDAEIAADRREANEFRTMYGARRQGVPMTAKALRAAVDQAIQQDVPPPPDTLDEVLRLQQAQGRRP